MPAFYKPEKMPKFYRHWSHRLGLEAIQIKHSMKYGQDPTPQQRRVMQGEIEKYINDCYEHEKMV